MQGDRVPIEGVDERVVAMLRQEAEKRGLVPKSYAPLWPEEFCKIDGETAYRFLIEHCRTYEQAGGLDLRFPEKEYIKDLCMEWHYCYEHGEPLHIIKSRRLIVSWVCTALELHLAGCRRGKFCVAAEKYEGLNGSQQFIHRVWYVYDQLRRNNPSWKLEKPEYTGKPEKEYLEKLILPNGSTFDAINASGGSFQGTGVTVARLEELSQYAQVSRVWAQAMFVTEGVPGEKRGFAYSVSNATPNEEYIELLRPTA